MGLCTLVGKGMLQPVHIVTLGVVGTIVRTATLRACQRAVYGRLGTFKQETQLNGLNQFSVEYLALILQLHLFICVLQAVERLQRMMQTLLVAFNEYLLVHLVLQCTAYVCRRLATGGGIE